MKENKVFVIQEIAGTQSGNPKINIVGATEYGDLKFLSNVTLNLQQNRKDCTNK